MENTEIKKRRYISQDRITLKGEVLERLNQWAGQLKDACKGTKVKHGDIVEWLVMTHAPALSVKELNEFKDQYFDEVQFASWALKTLREAHSRGEKVSLTDIISASRPKPSEKRVAPRRTAKAQDGLKIVAPTPENPESSIDVLSREIP
jgi:hypothetical protein